MRIEDVKAELERWGEIIVTTSAGRTFELHLGDTEFDLKERVIRLTTPDAIYVIDGDEIESIKKHYGHAGHAAPAE